MNPDLWKIQECQIQIASVARIIWEHEAKHDKPETISIICLESSTLTNGGFAWEASRMFCLACQLCYQGAQGMIGHHVLSEMYTRLMQLIDDESLHQVQPKDIDGKAGELLTSIHAKVSFARTLSTSNRYLDKATTTPSEVYDTREMYQTAMKRLEMLFQLLPISWPRGKYYDDINSGLTFTPQLGDSEYTSGVYEGFRQAYSLPDKRPKIQDTMPLNTFQRPSQPYTPQWAQVQDFQRMQHQLAFQQPPSDMVPTTFQQHPPNMMPLNTFQRPYQPYTPQFSDSGYASGVYEGLGQAHGLPGQYAQTHATGHTTYGKVIARGNTKVIRDNVEVSVNPTAKPKLHKYGDAEDDSNETNIYDGDVSIDFARTFYHRP